MIVALVGPHAVGKTTVGRRLAEALGWAFDDEIGRILREEALARDPSAHALASGPAFDAEVFRRELERDRGASGPRIVETWHPGNFAYARLRSPLLASEWEKCLADASRGAIVAPLVAPRAVLAARRSEPGPAEIERFFARVGVLATRTSTRWGCRVLPPVRTDRPLEAVVEAVLLGLRRPT